MLLLHYNPTNLLPSTFSTSVATTNHHHNTTTMPLKNQTMIRRLTTPAPPYLPATSLIPCLSHDVNLLHPQRLFQTSNTQPNHLANPPFSHAITCMPSRLLPLPINVSLLCCKEPFPLRHHTYHHPKHIHHLHLPTNLSPSTSTLPSATLTFSNPPNPMFSPCLTVALQQRLHVSLCSHQVPKTTPKT